MLEFRFIHILKYSRSGKVDTIAPFYLVSDVLLTLHCARTGTHARHNINSLTINNRLYDITDAKFK